MTEAEHIQETTPFVGPVGTDRCYIDFHIVLPDPEISPQDTLTDVFETLIVRTSVLIDKTS